MTPDGLEHSYQRFGRTCCLNLQRTYLLLWWLTQQWPPKSWYETTDVPTRPTQFKFTQFLKKSKILTFLKKPTEFFSAGMKAHGDEGGGRILLGDNTGGGRSGSSVFGVWISTGLPCIYMYSWPHVYKHFAAYVILVVTYRKVRLKSNFAQAGIEYTYSQLYMHIQGRSVRTQIPTHWYLIGHRLCYRPAVFFRHLRLHALWFLHRKIRRVSKLLLFVSSLS